MGATKPLLPFPGALDEVARTGEHGANRCPEALAEVDPYRVEAASEIRGGGAGGDYRVQQPGPIAVGAEAVLVGQAGDGPNLLNRPAAAAAEVGGLLDRQETRDRRVPHRWTQRGGYLGGREDAALSSQRAQQGAADDRRGAGLGGQRVRRLVDDDLVACIAVDGEGDLVAHRP